MTGTDPTANVTDVTVAHDRTLYRLSSMVDLLRDTTREILELTGPVAEQEAPGHADRLALRYLRLRQESATLLRELGGAHIDVLYSWTDDFEPSDATLLRVLTASSELARCLDVVLQEDVFVANRINAHSEVQKVLKSVTPGLKETTGRGQYL